MIKVYTSDSGQYVLVHPASQTFIIDESLEQGFRRVEEHVRAHHPEMVGRVMEVDDKPRDNRAVNSRIAQVVLLVGLALLPFLWLFVMQQSLASLVSEWRIGSSPVVQTGEEQAALRQELDQARLELNRLLTSLHALNMRVMDLEEAYALPGRTLAPAPDAALSENGPADDEPADGAAAGDGPGANAPDEDAGT